LTRNNFRDLSIYQFELGNNQNQKKIIEEKDIKIMAGFHNYSFGMTADIVV